VAPFVVVTDDRVGLAESIAGGLETGDDVDAGPDAVLSSPYVLLGTADEIADTLRERRERWQLSYYVCNDASVETMAPIVERLAGS
jgi:hypothetical protein